MLTWLSEYRRLHLIDQGKPWITHSVHMDQVNDLTFSHSGKYFCSSSKDLITIWHIEDYESKRIIVLNKLMIEHFNHLHPTGVGFFDDDSEFKDGISYTLFNQSDDLLLVNGMRMMLNVDSGKEYKVLIYSFPELVLVRKLRDRDQGFSRRHINPSWFGKTTFIAAEHTTVDMPEELFDRDSALIIVHSALSKNFKTLLEFPNEVDDVDIINHSPTGGKVLIFSFQDEEIRQGNDDFPIEHNNLAVCLITSGCEVGPHTCTTRSEKGAGTVKYCCIESKFTSTELEHYACEELSQRTVCVNAAIRQVETEVVPGAIGVVCRPYQSTPEGPKYSETQVDFRIFDFELNFLRVVVDLASVVPPSLFLFEHDYWIDKQYMITPGDLNPGVLHYFDFHYEIFIRKETGHFEGINCAAFNPKDSRFLVTVSDDFLIKFWDVTSS